MTKKRLAFLAVILALLMGIVPTVGQTQESLQPVVVSYFSEGAKTIKATDLFELLNDGDPDNDPYIISLRSAEDYAKGHIPGAVLMDVKTMFIRDNLMTIPPDRKVVVACYTGQTAAQAAAALNMLGYDAYNLLYGMSSWTTDPEVYVKRFEPATCVCDRPVETTPNEPGGPYELPIRVTSGVVSVASAVESYFGKGLKTVKPVDLFEILNDGDADNDPYIISIRAPEDYAKGHLPGAVNIDIKTMFTLDNLETISPDREIVVVCYTGQSGAQATVGLNILGYDAYSLLYGMSSWTEDPAVYVKRFEPAKDADDYPPETAPNEPGGPYLLPMGVTTGADGLEVAAEKYFSEGPCTIKAPDLFELLSDGYPDNDPYIISLCVPEDYAKGHIPGAVNMDVKTMFTPENLATIPHDRDVVLVCYTGQTVCQATAALNVLGYTAHSLLYGMSSWTSDPEVYVKRFDPEKDAHDYPVETTASEPGSPYELPSEVSTESTHIAERAEAYFGGGPRLIEATELANILEDDDPDNDPYIVSVRNVMAYTQGHVPGAVRMDIDTLFSPGMLATIPPDREVVVVGYTGQTAGQATAILNMLGYDALSLRYGMSSWTTDPKVYMRRFDPEKDVYDHPVETKPHALGEIPESVAIVVEETPEPTPSPAPTPKPTPKPKPVAETEALLPIMPGAENCVDCHTDQPVLQELAVDKEVKSDKTSGEG